MTTSQTRKTSPVTLASITCALRLLFLAVFAVTGLALVGGCHSHKEIRQYDASSNGQTITIPQGQMFSLRMLTNVQLKARWEIVDLDSGILRAMGEPRVMGAVPVGGLARVYTYNYMFGTVAKGQTTLNMKLVDPDSGELLDSYSVTIVVTDPE